MSSPASFNNKTGMQLSEYPCRYLKGIGPKNAEKLEKLGIFTVQDVLFHLPLRYEDRTKLIPISEVLDHKIAVVSGTVQSAQIIRRPKPQLVCYITDETEMLVLRFIHYTNYQREKLKPGVKIFAVGEPRQSYQYIEIIHPEYQVINPGQPVPLADSLTPVYPTTEGVSQRLWTKLTDQALVLLNNNSIGLEELLPEEMLKQYDLPSLKQALNAIHRPEKNVNLSELQQAKHPTQLRLIIEELLSHRLALLKLRFKQQENQAKAIILKPNLLDQFRQNLLFELTNAQKTVLTEIESDIAKNIPMMRLVQGDVGSGKTVVAALAALHVIGNQSQAVMMAPTELLAEQHYKNMQQWFEPLGIKTVLLKSSLGAAKRREVLSDIKQGEAGLIVGTHAVFQKEVDFDNLVLVIIDEQHRFGVHQRLALKSKGAQGNSFPHQLVMTATPIPRTLAMNFYADLDCSVIDELPKGRKPIKTLAISNEKRDSVIERIAEICKTGQQVYWVCPLIEESEVLECQAAELSFQYLQQQLSSLSIGLVHGRLKAKEKEAVMQDFVNKKINILVATTVIEVGVDVPNASLMVIENAERMGLAQLHQLRGRVGRGELESYCILLYKPPLKGTARERVSIMRETNDGFKIAEKDLKIRGPGEVLGTKQTGEVSFQIADVMRDQDLLPVVQKLAEQLWQESPECCEKIISRWLGNKEQFAAV